MVPARWCLAFAAARNSQFWLQPRRNPALLMRPVGKLGREARRQVRSGRASFEALAWRHAVTVPN